MERTGRKTKQRKSPEVMREGVRDGRKPKAAGTAGRTRARRSAETEPSAAPEDAAIAASETTEESSAQTEAPEVGEQLRRVRSGRGMSLEALARASGVSRAMLSQIELGRSTPTIKVLWKV